MWLPRGPHAWLRVPFATRWRRARTWQVLQHDCNHILLVTVISADPALYVTACEYIYVGMLQAP
jgi:hypothetical protein